MVDPAIVDAVAALNPQPRRVRWTSLSYCLLDAVWSIAARYRAVVVPLVRRVAADNGDEAPVTASDGPLPADPLPLPRLLARYGDEQALRAATNGQRTSTRGGITKAKAVLCHARILVDHQIVDLADAERLLAGSTTGWDELNGKLKQIHGEGEHGIRRGYLWTLCGSDDLIKPDRMILRWLARHGTEANAVSARLVLEATAAELTRRLQRPVTPWMVDHAIWDAERSRKRPPPPTTSRDGHRGHV